jgi:hypothetical protein
MSSKSPARKSVPLKIRLSVVAVFAVITGLIAYGIFSDHAIRITESVIKDRLTHTVGRSFEVHNIAAAAVKFVRVDGADAEIANDKIHVTADLFVRMNHDFGDARISVSAIGAPEWRDGAFYFKPDEMAFKDLKLLDEDGAVIVTPEALKKAREKLVPEKLKSVLSTFGKNLEKDVANAKADSAAPLGSALARIVFERVPVYRLKDDAKGFLLSQSLRSVAVENGAVVATFSLSTLAFNAGLALIAFVAFLGFLACFPAITIVAAIFGAGASS